MWRLNVSKKGNTALEIVNKIKYRINGKYVDKLSLSASEQESNNPASTAAGKQTMIERDIVCGLLSRQSTTPRQSIENA